MSGIHVPCARGACVGKPVHLADRHLDPRDELYDGPHTDLAALPHLVRDSARRIVAEAPALMPEVVELAREIDRLRQQVAAVRVDKDRQVRAAMARAESCKHHGREIQELGRQLHAAGQRADAEEGGRIALLGFFQSVRDLVNRYRSEGPSAIPPMDKMMGALAKAARKTGAAHDRAWKR